MVKYRYGISRIIKHPQGTYRVAYNSNKRSLGNSVLLWFRNKKGQYIKDENHSWNKKQLMRLKV